MDEKKFAQSIDQLIKMGGENITVLDAIIKGLGSDEQFTFEQLSEKIKNQQLKNKLSEILERLVQGEALEYNSEASAYWLTDKGFELWDSEVNEE